jgi:hypothetical protein
MQGCGPIQRIWLGTETFTGFEPLTYRNHERGQMKGDYRYPPG